MTGSEPNDSGQEQREGSVKTLIVGLGGATNSGKTTLAKHLLRLFPAEQAIILHQDDFALPEAQLPWNETLQARDWDHPIGTIDYDRLYSVLLHARQHGTLPPHHSSHDHLNVQPALPIDDSLASSSSSQLSRALQQSGIQRVILVDGFLLYYDQRVRSQMDVRIFLRCGRETIHHRRLNRGGYATAEDTVWQDPPGYFEHVVWPGYVEAHKRMFSQEDVEKGALIDVKQDQKDDGTPIANLALVEAESLDINETVKVAVDAILRAIQSSHS